MVRASPLVAFFANPMEKTMNDTTRVEGPFGPVLKVSERLPAFLRFYPMSERWGTEVDCVDLLSCRPGQMEVIKEGMRNGHPVPKLPNPNELSGQYLVFRARLTKDGHVLCNRSCLQFIENEYDYETGETRAVSRLMAACGIGYEDIDYDMVDDIHARSLLVSPNQSDVPDEAEFDTDPDLTPTDEEVKTIVELPKPEKPESDIPEHIQSSVDAIAAALTARKEKFELPTNKKEALNFIRQGNCGNGASP